MGQVLGGLWYHLILTMMDIKTLLSYLLDGDGNTPVLPHEAKYTFIMVAQASIPALHLP
jgi:hypothetical protein